MANYFFQGEAGAFMLNFLLILSKHSVLLADNIICVLIYTSLWHNPSIMQFYLLADFLMVPKMCSSCIDTYLHHVYCLLSRFWLLLRNSLQQWHGLYWHSWVQLATVSSLWFFWASSNQVWLCAPTVTNMIIIRVVQLTNVIHIYFYMYMEDLFFPTFRVLYRLFCM